MIDWQKVSENGSKLGHWLAGEADAPDELKRSFLLIQAAQLGGLSALDLDVMPHRDELVSIIITNNPQTDFYDVLMKELDRISKLSEARR